MYNFRYATDIFYFPEITLPVAQTQPTFPTPRRSRRHGHSPSPIPTALDSPSLPPTVLSLWLAVVAPHRPLPLARLRRSPPPRFNSESWDSKTAFLCITDDVLGEGFAGFASSGAGSACASARSACAALDRAEQLIQLWEATPEALVFQIKNITFTAKVCSSSLPSFLPSRLPCSLARQIG